MNFTNDNLLLIAHALRTFRQKRLVEIRNNTRRIERMPERTAKLQRFIGATEKKITAAELLLHQVEMELVGRGVDSRGN